MWKYVGFLLGLAGCAAQPPARVVNYRCGDPPVLEVSAAYLQANPDVKLRVEGPVDFGVAIGTGRHSGLSLSLGKTFPLRPQRTSITWPDGTTMTCVPDTRVG